MSSAAEFKAFGEALSGDLVLIIANPGPHERNFTVHKDIICSQSKYFEKALNGEFQESEKKEIKLPDIDAECLQGVLYWAYSQRMPGQGITFDAFLYSPRYLAGLWLVADRLLLPKMQNAVIVDLCNALYMQHLEVDTVLEIYDNTTPDSVLRKLACREIAYCTIFGQSRDPQHYTQCFEELERFGLQLCNEILEVKRCLEAGDGKRQDAFDTSLFMIAER